MQKNVKYGDAVSPVVGVMLMLFVTIIIAAVVSAFAGGLAQTSPKAPQVSISAEAHNYTDIIINFNGGDTLDPGAITVKTFIPEGADKDMSNKVNLSDNANVIYLPTGFGLNNCTTTTNSYGTYTSCTWNTIQPGDSVRINWPAAFAYTTYGYEAPALGEPVDIEIYDSASGKMIATTRATVTS